MKTLAHGHGIWFQCLECGCEFICKERECRKEELRSFAEVINTDYFHDCPECGNENLKGKQWAEVRKQREGHNSAGGKKHEDHQLHSNGISEGTWKEGDGI